jgi:hypothetical protein
VYVRSRTRSLRKLSCGKIYKTERRIKLKNARTVDQSGIGAGQKRSVRSQSPWS